MELESTHAQAPSAPAIPGISLGALLGRGGFATVWEGTAEGGERVAVKVGHSDAAVMVERFRREAEAMEKIGAPAVPRLAASGRTGDGRPYVVMERLSGETLEAKLAAMTRPPPIEWVARAADGILAALSSVHEKGLLHRDVKPANVFFASPEERVALLDLGLVRSLSAPQDPITAGAGSDPREADLTRTGVAVGTPEYMAPEQIRAEKDPGPQVDLYAFGVILYEMLTLHLPFAGAKAAVEHGHLLLRPRRPGELAAVPRPVEDLVLWCLAKDPARRPASAADVRAALAEACRSNEEPSAPRESGPSTSKLIAEGRHPVVVAVVDARGDGANVAATVAARGGFVPRQRGARYVAVFSGLGSEDPLRAAAAAARELVDGHGARAALHLAEVTIRRRERGAPGAHGAALDRPETWLPPEPWSGVFYTPAITRLLPEDATAFEQTVLQGSSDGAPGEAAPDTLTGAPLVGRAALMEAMAASVTAVFEARRPALYTVLGEPGAGKTRLCAEAAALAARAHPGARVVPLRAVPPGAGTQGRLTMELLRALGDADGATLREGPLSGHHDAVQAIFGALRQRYAEGPLAVILDDAQWADDAALDALEYASLDAADCPLWVFIAAQPRLIDLRGGWGKRTRSAERVMLSPLDAEAAAELAGHLLAPAEYPPAALLDSLARWSGGNPASLTEIVRALKRAGVVRKRPSGESYQVATAALDALPPSPSWQWLAARRLAALPAELSACLRLGAVLGAAFTREELEAVQAELERAGGAGTTVDAGAGLRALAAEGLLSAGAGEQYSFSNALLHDAVYELIDPAQRAEVHRAALAYHRRLAALDAPAGRLASLARHAAAAGARDEAAAARLRLGDLAAAKHRHLEADQHYSAALEALPGEDVKRRAVLLCRRGASRIHIDRARDAVTDLREAQGIAASTGDDALTAELLLEEATALDWIDEFERSARRAEEAAPLVAAAASPVLEARLLVAQGRAAWRAGRVADSIDLLERGRVRAIDAGDYPSRVIALLCLTWQLATAGRLDEAAARFEEVIALTTGAGDLQHLCGAYINRRQLWTLRGDLEHAILDLRRAIALARETGNPAWERYACFNVAELLYWSGRTEEAIELCRRGCLLAERFVDRPEGWGPLYLALYHLDRGDSDEAARLAEHLGLVRPYDVFGETDVARRRRTVLSTIKLVLAGQGADPRAWDELEEQAEKQDVRGSGLLGVLYWRARCALRRGQGAEAARTIEKARAWLPRSPLWRTRFDALPAGCDAP